MDAINKETVEKAENNLNEMVKRKDDFDYTQTDELRQMLETLKEIRDSENKEMMYAKRQSTFSMIISTACLLIVVSLAFAIFTIIPKLNGLITNVNTLVSDATDIINESEEIMNELSKVTEDIAAIDIPKLFTDVDELVAESQETVSATFESVQTIDFEGLNSAIKDLQSVVSPLAKLFGKK